MIRSSYINFTSVKWVSGPDSDKESLTAVVDGVIWSIPNNAEGNAHYDEIMRQVAEGTLTIADAD
tara:strand:- start:371 stop:565 length:195 start_codon:yes stop_codon:yes gene_type:complete